MAGNVPTAQGFDLHNPSFLSHESSGEPLQPSKVVDAGFDVSRMLLHGHMRLGDLSRNVVGRCTQVETGRRPYDPLVPANWFNAYAVRH